MGLRIDHIVVVGDLQRHAQALRASGWVGEDGGHHEESPTRNVIVAIDDSSYVELLDFSRAWLRPLLRLLSKTPLWRIVLSRRPMHERLFLSALTLRSGPAMFAFAIDDLESFVSRAASRGLILGDPVHMSRRRPDGSRVEWSLVVSPHPDLPFFLQDRTARSARVPTIAPTFSDSIRAVRMAVPDVQTTTGRYETLFGVLPAETSEGTIQFDRGGVCVEIVPGQRDSAPTLDCELRSGHRLSALLGCGSECP